MSGQTAVQLFSIVRTDMWQSCDTDPEGRENPLIPPPPHLPFPIECVFVHNMVLHTFVTCPGRHKSPSQPHASFTITTSHLKKTGLKMSTCRKKTSRKNCANDPLICEGLGKQCHGLGSGFAWHPELAISQVFPPTQRPCRLLFCKRAPYPPIPANTLLPVCTTLYGWYSRQMTEGYKTCVCSVWLLQKVELLIWLLLITWASNKQERCVIWAL